MKLFGSPKNKIIKNENSKNVIHLEINALYKNCPKTEFFWSLLSRIRPEYGDLLRKSPYSGQMR